METVQHLDRVFTKDFYDEMYKEASSDETREQFWRKQADKVIWDQFPEQILDDSNPPFYRWYPDGKINICKNAIDVNVEKGRGEQLALIYDSAYTKTVRKFTYNDMLKIVSKLSRVLVETFNVSKGDRVLIYMPNIPEAVFAMLAWARIGAIHSVVYGGFAAKELSNRINDWQPKLIIAASCGLAPGEIIKYIPNVNSALEISNMNDLPRLVVQRHDIHYELDLDSTLF